MGPEAPVGALTRALPGRPAVTCAHAGRAATASEAARSASRGCVEEGGRRPRLGRAERRIVATGGGLLVGHAGAVAHRRRLDGVACAAPLPAGPDGEDQS